MLALATFHSASPGSGTGIQHLQSWVAFGVIPGSGPTGFESWCKLMRLSDSSFPWQGLRNSMRLCVYLLLRVEALTCKFLLTEQTQILGRWGAWLLRGDVLVPQESSVILCCLPWCSLGLAIPEKRMGK